MDSRTRPPSSEAFWRVLAVDPVEWSVAMETAGLPVGEREKVLIGTPWWWVDDWCNGTVSNLCAGSFRGGLRRAAAGQSAESRLHLARGPRRSYGPNTCPEPADADA